MIGAAVFFFKKLLGRESQQQVNFEGEFAFIWRGKNNGGGV